MGDGIHSSKSDKSVNRRIEFLAKLESLEDKQLAIVWKNQRLFASQIKTDMVSQLEEDLMFDTSEIMLIRYF